MRPTKVRDCAGSRTSGSSCKPIFNSAAKAGTASMKVAASAAISPFFMAEVPSLVRAPAGTEDGRSALLAIAFADFQLSKFSAKGGDRQTEVSLGTLETIGEIGFTPRNARRHEAISCGLPCRRLPDPTQRVNLHSLGCGEHLHLLPRQLPMFDDEWNHHTKGRIFTTETQRGRA